MKRSLLFTLPAAAYLLHRLSTQGSTEPIEGEKAIAELKKVNINGTDLSVMIRGTDRSNPVLLCVAGGPCGSELPLSRRYEKELEKSFTVVHYDQRGAGKSFHFSEDYAGLDYHQHVDDLIALTEYLLDYLGKDKLYLQGHSYGTYLAFQAADRKPEYYKAYIGIGQMSDTAQAESNNLEECIVAAREAGNEEDVKYLESLREKVRNGEIYTPREYVRKYHFDAHQEIPVVRETYLKMAFGPEYSLLDDFRMLYAANRNVERLALEPIKEPLSQLVKANKVPSYFLLGKYDNVTNTKAAKEYFDSLQGNVKREFIVFEDSAHSPQIEENEAYVRWMTNDLLKEEQQ